MGGTRGITGFLFSESAITVYSAIVATPIVLAFASRFSVPSLPSWIFLVIIAVVLFLVSAKFSGYLGAILRGVSLGAILNALFATGFGARLSTRIAQLQAGASG